ncbi:MAG: hydantoinase/oxoprolinase family protein [Pseudomonadales bacterium]|nr:hydantoinase/oxoprolinase family protein [Pseudomonadales bacterium]NIX07903.1 hydantoinase/oxoprolinase family protein [Pseudomonadales bacterium]
MAGRDASYRLAVDIGGTFTDVVLEPDAAGTERVSVKVLTTYDDPANGVMQGIEAVLERAGAEAGDARLVLHGTTLATNALIERRGARTALLTTEGHRDAVEMALENRFEQYDVNIDRPQPLVPRRLRLPVRERLDARGGVLRPLDLASVDAAVATLASDGVESVAIGFLHGYANPDHEHAAAARVREQLPDVSVTLASRVCPEIREYERLSTACANAYVKPLMARYLGSLQRKLADRGIDCPVLLMTSGGGLTTLKTAAEFPIRLVESGPAGGALLAARIAAEGCHDRVLSFDMGGTTAKICLIDDAAPLLSRSFEVDRTYRFKKGSGLPVRIPVIEMVEIGAGGGSIARVDKLSRITVGPDSAGSEPGPACYGRGGRDATVTDGDVVMGRLDPRSFAGGRLALDTAAAERAVADAIGDPLGLALHTAAFGISEVVDENMAAAARAHAVEWGEDTQGRTLVAYGGAAPLHAAQLAIKLKLDRVVIPAHAGVGSAIGFLIAPVSYEVVRSRYLRVSRFDADLVNSVMDEMRAEALEVVSSAADPDALLETRRAYMRYVGQGYEIAVPVPGGKIAKDAVEVLREAFDQEYRRLYRRTIPNLDVEVLSWSLALAAPQPELALDSAAERAVPAQATGRVELFEPRSGEMVEGAVYARADLGPGHWLEGPAVISEEQTTTVVPTGFSAGITGKGHLVLERTGGES